LDKLDEALVHVWEGIKDKSFKRETASFLFKRPTLYFLVSVLE
jgi:hypothetical protein